MNFIRAWMERRKKEKQAKAEAAEASKVRIITVRAGEPLPPELEGKWPLPIPEYISVNSESLIRLRLRDTPEKIPAALAEWERMKEENKKRASMPVYPDADMTFGYANWGKPT